MFVNLTRTELLHYVSKIGNRFCCYAGGTGKLAVAIVNTAKTSDKPKQDSGEQTGCPEMRVVYMLLKNMTDEQYAETLVTKGGNTATGNFGNSIVCPAYEDVATISELKKKWLLRKKEFGII